MTDVQSIWDKSDGGRLIYAAILGKDFCLEDPSRYNYLNPCYKDNNPSFSVYWSDKGDKWNHHDFGDNSYRGDAFNLIADYYGLDIKEDFPKILKKAEELLSNLKKGEINRQFVQLKRNSRKKKGKSPKYYALEEMNFDKKAISFWSQSGITIKTLKKYGVVQLSAYSFESKDGRKCTVNRYGDELMFAYKMPKGAKLYFPEREKPKKFRWVGLIPDHYIFGEYSEENGDGRIPLIITGGEKDALTLIANGFNAITFNSEVVSIPNRTLKDLYQSGYAVLSLLDDDATGRKFTKKFLDEYKIPPIPLWKPLNRGQRRKIKDITDYVSHNLSVDALQQLIDELVVEQCGPSESTEEGKSQHSEACEACEVVEAREAESHQQPEQRLSGLPQYFDPSIYDDLPSILSELTAKFDDRNIKDVVLLSSITAMGSLSSKVVGQYAEDKCQPNIYAFVQGGPASGKSAIKWGRFLVEAIDNRIYEESKNEVEKFKNLPPKEQKKKTAPVIKRLLFAADASKAAIARLFNNNKGRGLMIEEEADTISSNMSTDWGDISAFLRKAWEGSRIEAARTSSDIPLIVNNAFLSLILSGTPEQIKKLIPSHESGFFSRVCFYHLPTTVKWKRPNGKSRINIDSIAHLPEKVMELWEHLNQTKNDINFDLSEEQWDQFNSYFEKVHEEEYQSFGEHALQIIRRIGGTTFRIAMALTIARMIDIEKPSRFVECTDADFNTAMKMADYFRYHNLYVMSTYPSSTLELSGLDERYKSFFNALPSRFETSTAKEIASKLEIARSTYQRMLRKFEALRLIQREKPGFYSKISQNN